MNQSGTALRERSNRLPPSANASSTASFKAISVIGPGVASSSLSYSGLKPEYPSEWGYSYYRIEQQGEAWTYLLTVSGSNWRNKPYGYHAPGYLVCESCSSAGKGWGGLYHFSDQAKSQPATAAERAELRKEWVGYPYIQLGPKHLDQYGSREGILHARQRKGFGWTRWSRQWLYANLKLFNTCLEQPTLRRRLRLRTPALSTSHQR